MIVCGIDPEIRVGEGIVFTYSLIMSGYPYISGVVDQNLGGQIGNKTLFIVDVVTVMFDLAVRRIVAENTAYKKRYPDLAKLVLLYRVDDFLR